MKTVQNYKNHIRWYPPHHFVFYPVMLVLMGLSALHAWYSHGNERYIWIAIGIGFGCLTWVAFMLRQHYALTLQNRLVLLELRCRYFATTGNRFEPIEEQLTDSQLFALRFAPDNELPLLAERAVKENLAGTDIKKAISNWKPDHRRV
ncbi:hypothetical protein GR160_01385 [Flavobacterium sp. Sd200]|uniref:DUF6526 family protein n=1 Tax=Flavobacterium sp. Sd200 TaxID=2692211 RepID=UPI0013681E5F|nr:DUF6526 family protein [Flavobacterium sp. Sd200]MXN89866.1 hypothetical protein [Flavobacterium sp. Sd200]